MRDTVLLEELTWPEVQELLSRGVRTVVIVAASIEQHGPHLPMVTDTAIGQVVGEQLARRLGNALLAPPIRPACSDHHLAFPGSLSIPQEVFIETVVAYVRSLAPHGFDTFVLFSSHGGNFASLQIAGTRLQEEFRGKGVRIVTFAGLAALQDMMRVMVGTAAEMGAPQDVDAIHADVTETSIMMARHPHLVATDRIEVGYLGRSDANEIFTRGMRAITPNGIFGDPRRASVEIGNAVIERLTSDLADFVRRQLGDDGDGLSRG
ncbi:MAG: creatininase family protein [Armatimonadota bacterium]|nr:creatininase family protein [Armatimonadota bacterium]